MQRRKSQVYIELPPLPLSKRNDNATGAASSHLKSKGQVARPSLSMMRVEIPLKASSSTATIKRAAGTQNIEPEPSASDRTVIKRKRSVSDLAGSGGSNTKKPRESEPTAKVRYYLFTGPHLTHINWRLLG